MPTAFELNRQAVLSGGTLPGLSSPSTGVSGSMFEQTRQGVLSQQPASTPTSTPVFTQPAQPVAPTNIFQKVGQAIESKIPGGFAGAKQRVKEAGGVFNIINPFTAKDAVAVSFRQYVSDTFKIGTETAKSFAKLTPAYREYEKSQGRKISLMNDLENAKNAGLGTLSTLYRTSWKGIVLGPTLGSLKASRVSTQKILKGETLKPAETLQFSLNNAFIGVNNQPGFGEVVTDNPVAQKILDIGFMAVMLSRPFVTRKLNSLKLKANEIKKVADTLGVKPNASMGEISTAYKTKIVEFKDVFAGRGTPEQVIQVTKLNDSYNILKKTGVFERKFAGLFGKVNLNDLNTVSGPGKAEVKPLAITATISEKPVTMAPTEARNLVIGSEFENTAVGRKIVKVSFKAEELGQSLVVSTKISEVKPVTAETVRDLNKKLSEENTLRVREDTLTGKREDRRLDNEKNIKIAGSRLGFEIAIPETNITVYRAGTGEIKPGDHVTTEEIAKSYLSQREGSNLLHKTVGMKDLLFSEGIKEEFVYSPKTTAEDLITGKVSEDVKTVMDAIEFGDIEAGKQLHKELGIKESFDEIMSRVEDAQTQEIEQAKKELGNVDNLPADNPDRILAEIADKLGKHFKAPGALYKITGKTRTYRGPGGLTLTVGGDKANTLDNLFFSGDIESFAKTIKVLAFKFDKTFDDINSKIEKGDIDGSDYEIFKDKFYEITQNRPAYSKRSGTVDKNRARKRKAKVVGDKVAKTVSGKKGTVAEADIGGYSDAESIQKKLENIKAIEFPELLRMYKTLTNKTPVLKLLRSYLGLHRGGRVTLNREIFKTPKITTKVFAHELGHLTNYFPTKTMSRGNLLGRIGTLRRYMKNFLPEFPGGEGIITPKDRVRLRKEAKMLSKLPIKEEYEVTIGETKATPAEIISIWNDTMAGETLPELMDWIKKLSEQEKVQIVKGAIKGVLPQWANFSVLTKEKRIREVIKNAPADIRAKYQELVREEVRKRKLFALDEIKTELKDLTQLWKPFNVNTDPGYTKYRFSAKELYADALSVLFNDPALLKDKAPAFFKGFFNYIDLKPDIKEAFFGIQETLNAGDDVVFQERYKDLEKDYKTAEEVWLAQEIEKKNNKVNVIGILNTLFNDRNAVMLNKVKLAVKEGRDISDQINPLYDLAGLNYLEGAVKNLVVDNFQGAVTKASEVENGWSDLGKILQLERAIYERGELANPGGYDPETAQWTLDKMQEKMVPENWKILQEAKGIFRKGMQALVTEAKKEGFYRPELIEQMKANPAYATFQVLDYLDQNVTSAIYQQKGTLKGVANPATTSLMKMITTLRAMRYNKSKKVNLGFLKSIKEVEKAKTKWNGKIHVAVEPRDKNKALVRVVINGKLEGFYVDKDVGMILNHQTEATLNQLSTVTRLMTQAKIYRPLFTSLNLGFQMFNLSKDFQRAWRNMPDKTFGELILSYPKLVKNYITASPAAWRKATGKEDAIVKEMETAEIFGINRNDIYGSPDPGEEEVTRVLRRIGLVPGKAGRSKMKTLMKPIVKLFDGIELIGNYIEALPKVAGYKMLKKKLPEKQLAHYVRNYIGSPDFLTRGTATPITNNLFLFSNAAKEGIKGDLNMAFKSQTKGGWWFKLALGTIIPKMIQAAIAMGLAGTAYKRMMDGASEYDKTNYDIIPLGLDKKGKTIYIRSPKDETGRFYGALAWKFMNMLRGKDKQTLITNLTDVFSLWAGQLPNLTPSITGSSALITYLAGKNPWDGFRNRNIIPDTEFKAGFKYSFPIMLKWLANNQGASIVMPAYIPKGELSTLEKVLNLPVLANMLGRFVKVSDYGQQEIDKEIKTGIEQKSSQARIRKNKAIDEAIENNEPLDVEQALGHLPTNQEDLNKVKLMIKQLNIQKQEGKNTYVDNLIYAGTNEAKVEMLKRYKKELTPEEFSEILTIASTYKIISAEVVKDAFINQ